MSLTTGMMISRSIPIKTSRQVSYFYIFLVFPVTSFNYVNKYCVKFIKFSFIDIPEKEISHAKLQKYMGKFLYSPAGSKHRAYFKVAGNFSCGDKLPPVKVKMHSITLSVNPRTPGCENNVDAI